MAIRSVITPIRIFVQYLTTFNKGKIGQFAKAIAAQNVYNDVEL